MNPFIIIGIAVGAFLLGRQAEKKDWKPPRLSPGDFPDPRALPPAPEPEIGEAASFGVGPYMDAWNATPFQCEIYPAGADYTFLRPPMDDQHVSVMKDCSIIAAPKAWWDKAGAIVKAEYDAGVRGATELRRKLIEREAARCQTSTTAGSVAFAAEILERIEAAFPSVGAQPKAPGFSLNKNPRRNGGHQWTSRKSPRVTQRR